MKLVISTMKNEAPFLLEWLAWHRSIGFDRFLIYTNDCTDGTDHMLDRLDEMGVVHHRRNKVLKRGPHKSALLHALKDPVYAQADWIYVADADEFLNIKVGDGRVDDLIAAWPEADAIPVTWRLFSNNGQTDLPRGFLTEALTDAEPEEALEDARGRFVKSLFRADPGVTRLGLHYPIYADDRAAEIRWGSAESQAGGTPGRPRTAFGYDVAQVNHYAVRTVDAYLLKRDRGRANHTGETLDSGYWSRWNRGGARDVSILTRIDRARAEHDAFLTDEKLAFLDRAARALTDQRLAALKADPAFADLRAELVGAAAPAPSPAPAPAPELARGTTPAPDPAPAAALPPATQELVERSSARHQNRRNMLARMPKCGRAAEIGVWKGGFTHEILEITQPKELVLIDPWELLAEQSPDEWNHKRHEDAKAMRALFDEVHGTYGARADVTIRKGFSEEILASYPDDYFDWVYIDGNHQYDFVRRDVELSFRKVRPGGVIAGDDFFWQRNGRREVREAVLDAMGACGIDRKTSFSRLGQQFMIQVDKVHA